MVKSLSSAVVAAKNAAEQLDVFTHILTVTLTDEITGTTVIRMARATEDVVIGADTWKAFPFAVGESTEDLSGELREVTVGMLDLTGEVAAFLKVHDVDSARVDLGVAFWDGATNVLALTDTFTVVGYTAANERITLQLGGRNYLDAPMPARPLDRYRCGFQFGGTLCAYVQDNDGFIRQTCDYSLNGPNGCKVHDNDPRFGGFSSLPTKQE